MDQDKLNQVVAGILHIDVGLFQDSDIIPIMCNCQAVNCQGWRVVSRSALELDTMDDTISKIPSDDSVDPSEIVTAECRECRGEAFKVITRGRAALIPVEFTVCSECGVLGVLSDGVVLPVSAGLSDMLAANYKSEYQAILNISLLAKRALMVSKAHLN